MYGIDGDRRLGGLIFEITKKRQPPQSGFFVQKRGSPPLLDATTSTISNTFFIHILQTKPEGRTMAADIKTKSPLAEGVD